MAAVNAPKCIGSLFLGTCLPSLKQNASKFKVQYFYFDEFLKAYFRKSIQLFAYDPQKICKVGDVALLQELPKRISLSLNHKVLEVVYPFGDVTDPITGKKVVRSQSRDEIDVNNSLLGNTKSKFNYKAAPIRGWQEGRKDFTHRPSYRRYNEFDEEDENRDQPYSTFM